MIFIILNIIEELWTGLMMIIKFPLRIVCKIKDEHDWKWHGGGFLFDSKYSFTCRRCGLRCNGDINKMNKHGFNGTAKIK